MDQLLMWNTEHWTDLDDYETMIHDHGGMEYATAQKVMQEAGSMLEQTLPQEKLVFFHTYADAVIDAYASREAVATRIALIHGIAMGAVLERFRKVERPEVLMALANGVTTEMLASGLIPTVAMSVIETIRDVFIAAEAGAFHQKVLHMEDAANNVDE